MYASKKLIPFNRCLMVVNVAVFMSMVGTASADQQDVVNFTLNHAVTYDDNLFKLDRNESPTTTFGKSQRWEMINATTYGVSINKPYSLQRFKFDVNQTSYRYQNYNFLNFDGTNYDIQWNWSLTPYLKGNIVFDRQQLPNTFANITSINPLTTNTRTVKSNRFDIDWSPQGNWHLLGGVTDLTVTTDNSSPTQNNIDFSFEQTSARAGVRYDLTSGSNLEYGASTANGKYGQSTLNEVLFTDQGYEEKRQEFKFNWVLSGKSKLNLSATYLDRNNDNFSQRDVSGWIGAVNYSWDVTGKTRINFIASTDLFPTQAISYTYVRQNLIAIRPIWSVTSKVIVRGDLTLRERAFEGFAPAPPAEDRHDRTRLASISASWEPRRFVSLGVMLKREVRDSNLINDDYVSNSAMINAGLTF
ncbi:MAG TPA: XrtB/PEP-CTERM-associated polysaccharide biosynthesis outer membrane protein EpsL [Methylophilus sp.]|nr:XrtB/PEP-CTERM-associated polysaccharide biosynthesis outer membrane protein EpsL [Methylophilus sp.]